MYRSATKYLILAAGCLLWAHSALAQGPPQRNPLSFTVDGGMAFQSNTDLKDGEGSFSTNRWAASIGVNWAFDYRNSIGLTVSGVGAKYDFDELAEIGGGEPWDKIDETRISLFGRFGFGENGSIIIGPSFRYSGEDDSDTSEGRTWGLFAGAAWRISPDLTIGPGFGIFSKLEDGTRFFPILIIDWNITERWNLSTGGGLGASQGPGLRLGYELNDRWSFGLTGRYENLEFRLNENGNTPNGIGQDKSFPLVLSTTWNPHRIVKLSVFAGAEFGGKLKLRDSEGDLITSSKYNTALIYGATAEFRF